MAMIHVSRSGATLGIFEESRVREGLRTGEFIGTDLGWEEGMPAWRPLSELDDWQTHPPPAVAAPVSQTVPASTPLPAPERTGLPWENRSAGNFAGAFVQTVGMVLTKPAEAFTVMRREGGLLDPLLYALIGGMIGTIVSFLFTVMFQSIGVLGSGNDAFAILGVLGVGSVVFLVLMPVFIILGIFIFSAIVHLGLMLLGGANKSFETTVRVISFAGGSANVLSMIPMCGGLIALVWGIVLYCIGLARAHETDTGRAVGAVLLPLVVCCGAGILLALLIPAFAAASKQ